MTDNGRIYLSVEWMVKLHYLLYFTTMPFQEPLLNRYPLSPPVSNYTITVNGNTTITVADTSVDITVAIGNGEYTVMVVANNDVGPSTGNPSANIGKSSIIIAYYYNHYSPPKSHYNIRCYYSYHHLCHY